jgi:hypothetical protein
MVLRSNRKAQAFASAPSALAILAARKYGLIALSPRQSRIEIATAQRREASSVPTPV